MYEDTPQELVHDLFSEAVFGSHALGRPVIGTRDVLSTVPKRTIANYHRTMYTPGNIVIAAAGNLQHEQLLRLLERGAAEGDAVEGPARPAAAREDAARRRALPAQEHGAVPRVHRRARHLSLRPPPFRRVAARRDPRRVGFVAPLPGDPREARHGVRGLQLRRAVLGHRPVRRLHRDARGEPRRRRSRSPPSRSPTSQRATSARSELERAKENLKGRITLSMESTSNRMSRLGKSLITDTELLSLRADHRRDRRGRARGRRRARVAAARTGAALRFRDRPERGALQARARPLAPGPAGARRGVKVALLGAGGKVGSVLAPALEAAGHELVDLEQRRRDGRLHHAGRGDGERRACARGRRAVRRRHDRRGPDAARRGARASAGSRSSTRRTSRSAPC